MRSWTGIAIIVALVLVSMGAALAANGSAASATAVATGPSGLGRIVVDGRASEGGQRDLLARVRGQREVGSRLPFLDEPIRRTGGARHGSHPSR